MGAAAKLGTIWALVIGGAALFASACGEDLPPPVALDVRWQLSCPDTGNCQPYQFHEVAGADGKSDIGVSCNVGERVEVELFEPGTETRPSSRLVLNASVSGTAATSCSVQVFEEQNASLEAASSERTLWSGICGEAAVLGNGYCAFTDVVVSGSQLTGLLRCDELGNDTMSNYRLSLTGPGGAGPVQVAINN